MSWNQFNEDQMVIKRCAVCIHKTNCTILNPIVDSKEFGYKPIEWTVIDDEPYCLHHLPDKVKEAQVRKQARLLGIRKERSKKAWEEKKIKQAKIKKPTTKTKNRL